MFNFSANHLFLPSRTEYRTCVVFLMQDHSTRRVYRMYNFIKSQLITSGHYYCVSGKLNSADKLYLVIESVKRDTEATHPWAKEFLSGSRDSDRAKSSLARIPLAVFTRQPSFHDPGLTTHDWPSQTAQRPHAILYIENGPHWDGANALVLQVGCERLDLAHLSSWLQRAGWLKSLSVVMPGHLLAPSGSIT